MFRRLGSFQLWRSLHLSGHQIAKDKEVPISSEVNVAKYTAFMKKPYEPRASSDTQVDSSLPKDSATPNMALSSEGMDDISNSSWLCLDSSTSDNPVLSKSKLQGGTIGEDSASRNFTIGKTVTEEGHTTDIVQQSSSCVYHTSKTPKGLW